MVHIIVPIWAFYFMKLDNKRVNQFKRDPIYYQFTFEQSDIITYWRMEFSKKLIFLSNLTITRAQKNLYHDQVIECRPVG